MNIKPSQIKALREHGYKPQAVVWGTRETQSRCVLWLILPIAVLLAIVVIAVLLAFTGWQPPKDTAFGHGVLGLWALTGGRGRG